MLQQLAACVCHRGVYLAAQLGLECVERLANLLEKTEATEFLTAAGSSSYLKPGDLPVPIRFHEYQPQPYDQGVEFVPFMSVVDCLARHGPERTLDLIRSGRNVALRGDVVHPMI